MAYNYMNRSLLNSQLGTVMQDSSKKYETQNKTALFQVSATKKHKLSMILDNLQKAYREFWQIKEEKKITEDQILRSLEKGLKLLSGIQAKTFLEKGKELFQKCEIIAFQADQIYKYFLFKSQSQQKVAENNAKNKKTRPQEQVKEEQKPENFLEQNFQERGTKKLLKKPQRTLQRGQNMHPQKDIMTIHKKKSFKSENAEEQAEVIHSKESLIKEYLDNPYAYQNSDQARQKVKSITKQTNFNEPIPTIDPSQDQFQKLYLPNLLDMKGGIQVNGREVVKVSGTESYENIYTKQSLKMGKIYCTKLRVKKLGSFGIGLVPSAYKKQKVIDDRKKIPALKYFVFENGGGKIILCGQISKTGQQVGLKNNKTLQMIINIKSMKVLFRNEKFGVHQVTLPQSFKDYPLYVFLEMKQQDTCLQFL